MWGTSEVAYWLEVVSMRAKREDVQYSPALAEYSLRVYLEAASHSLPAEWVCVCLPLAWMAASKDEDSRWKGRSMAGSLVDGL